MDSGVLGIMVPAFAECLVLVGIHSYLGLHVIKRKVIFVDLALAQIAALGATVGFLFGLDPTSHGAFVFSMAFTFTGAAVFALSRLRSDVVPQEAVIGLVYALAAAIAILVIDKSPHGAEHIKDLLTGTILWVRWPEIISSAVAYSLIGLFHYLLRGRFILITESPEKAYQAGMWVRLWDFLFYLSFGFVITFSVRTAGVLLVFVFLVAPAISAVLLTSRWRTQLLIGWGMGTLVTVLALWLSYVLDLPSGPTVVAFYGVVLLLVSLVVFVVRAQARRPALLRLAAGIGGTLAVVAALWALGTGLSKTSLARDQARRQTRQLMAHQHHDHHHGAHGGADAAAAPPATRPGAPPATQPASLPAAVLEDPEARLAAIGAAVAARATGWRTLLADAVADPELPLLYKARALALLRARAGTDFGYDPDREDNSAAVLRLRAWASAPDGGRPPAGKAPK
jgi:zinc/manganese transport system permease protein